MYYINTSKQLNISRRTLGNSYKGSVRGGAISRDYEAFGTMVVCQFMSTCRYNTGKGILFHEERHRIFVQGFTALDYLLEHSVQDAPPLRIS